MIENSLVRGIGERSKATCNNCGEEYMREVLSNGLRCPHCEKRWCPEKDIFCIDYYDGCEAMDVGDISKCDREKENV